MLFYFRPVLNLPLDQDNFTLEQDYILPLTSRRRRVDDFGILATTLSALQMDQ